MHDENEAVAHARRYREGGGDPEAFVRAFRQSTVYLQRIDPLSLPVVTIEGLHWLAAFSSPELLQQHLAARGESTEAVYLAVTGGRLLDHYLPALPRRTGVVFDNGAEHMMSLPPVRGIVSDELAVDA
ncbi:SseB family protein [Lentzea kentuckyensis]|uniref:SseB family protein n=1 Tax=Lentzea kentuckyensis TaxID=360086 RepID=UPI000A3BA351|nr:SseB family protein [Lentzea kentuckyensis]